MPHYEKMLEDNAQLLYIPLVAYRLTSDELFARASAMCSATWKVTFICRKRAVRAGSQDADEKYYSLSLVDRQQRAKPE